MPRLSTLIPLLLLVGTPLAAQVDWLPPEIEDAAARGMVRRLDEAGVDVPGTPDEKLRGATQAIRGLTGRIDSWGLDGIFARAPELARIERPDFGDPLVKAIADYGFCTLPLHPELVSSQDEKLTVVLGEYGVVLVSSFLRDRFLAAGGTDADLEQLLNTDAMNQLSYDIQVDADLRQYVATECGPMFQDLFGE